MLVPNSVAVSGYNPYTTILATNEQYLRTNLARVKAMIESVREGWESYLANPTKANEYMGTLNPTMDARTFMDSAVMQRRLIESPETKVSGLGTMSLERWQTLVQQLVELKVISKPIDPRLAFYEPR